MDSRSTGQGSDSSSQLLLDNDWIEAQRDALIDELRGQGYSDHEIRRMIRSARTAGVVSVHGNEIEWV